MPVSFYSISKFRESIHNICRKEKEGYQSCKKDICNLLKNHSFDNIWAMTLCLKEMGNIRILKIRVQNSFQNLSSADGFRLIVCCNKEHQTVAFLNVYPKRGKQGQLDQSREETIRQLKTYLAATKSQDLIEHDINSELEYK